MTEQQPREKMGCLKKLLLGVVIAGAVAVLAVVLTYLLWYRPAVAEMPVFETDYLVQWQADEVAGGEAGHAWPVIVRAVGELGLRPEAYQRDTIRGPISVEVEASLRPGHEGWDLLRGYVLTPQTGAALDRLRGVIETPVLGYTHTDEADPLEMAVTAELHPDFEYDPAEIEPSEHPAMDMVILSYAGRARRLSFLLLTRAYVNGFAGEAGRESVRDVEAALALARHMERQRNTMTSALSVGMAESAAETVLEVLARDADGVGPETLAALDGVFAAWQRREPMNPFEYSVLASRDLVQRTYSTKGHMTAVGVWRLAGEGSISREEGLNDLESSLTDAPAAEQAVSVLARVMFPPRDEVERLIDEIAALAAVAAGMQPWELDGSAVYQDLRERCDAIKEIDPGIGLWVAQARRNLDSLTDRRTISMTRVSAVRLTIAAMTYRAQHDAWPERAESLGGDPLAWLDGFTGEPLRLLAGDAGPMIYSAGTDRNDDGGRECEEPDQYWWPNNAAKMEKSRPEQYDGDWVLWAPSLHADRTAERRAAWEED